MEEELKYLNALNSLNGLGPHRLKKLLEKFSSAREVWEAEDSAWRKSQLSSDLIRQISEQRQKINPEVEWSKLQKENIKMVSWKDSDYPQLLREIPNPPCLIYYKSSAKRYDFNHSPMLAIVGSRKFTSYGRQTAESLARELARAGLTIVSGLAIGIDAFAHRGALEGGGQTIAVLGSSLEEANIGPRSNYQLAQNIVRQGALISDFPLDTPSSPGNFPARNRIMAGLCLGVLVVEAAIDSGSLITAQLSLEYNREVFAVPGSIYSPQSAGVHQLLKAGAKVTTSAQDILEELKLEEKRIREKIKKAVLSDPREETILRALSAEPLHIDRVVKKTKLEASLVSAMLAVMEMKGMVKNIGGQNYISL